MNRIAIIPARGGSKRIPNKNIREFFGKPIIQHAIDMALGSKLFDVVMVSTEDSKIADIAVEAGAEVPFMRPAKLADDHSSTVDVLLDVLDEYATRGISFEYGCCIYPTTPLIKLDHLTKGWKQIKSGFDSVFPVLAYSHPVMRCLKMDGQNIYWHWPEFEMTRSQDLETMYHDAGQWYWFNVAKMQSKRRLITKNSGFVKLEEIEAQDVDNDSDWITLELKYQLLNK